VRKKYYAPDAAGWQEDAILMGLPLREQSAFSDTI
jgi:hypothetical protein